MAKKIEDTITFVSSADNLMSFGKSFATLNGQPLDKDSIFDHLKEKQEIVAEKGEDITSAEGYAKSASAYVGKILVVVEDGLVTAYVINPDNTLKPIGDKETMDKLAAELAALSAKEAADVKKLTEKDKAIDAEIAALKAKDTAIDKKDAEQDISLGNHAKEIAALQEKDKNIDQTISNLDAAYKAADTTIKNSISALDTAYKAADKALDDRLKQTEQSLANVTNVMDFRGAVETLPETTAGYQSGDVIVVTGKLVDGTLKPELDENKNNPNIGKEFVCDGDKWVEFGNSSAEQAAIAALQSKTEQLETNKEDKTVVAGINTRLKTAESEIDTLQKDSATKAELTAVDQKVDANTSSITTLTKAHNTDKAALEKSIKDKTDAITNKINDLDTTITGVGVDSTLTALGQTDGKLTATAAKIQIAETQVTNLTKDLESKVDKDPNARLMTKTEGTQLADLVKLKPAETGAQVNRIETIATGDGNLAIVGKTVSLPAAMADKLGLVKGSTAENGIEVNEGIMSVHSLNVNKLVQSDNEELILDGGIAAGHAVKNSALNK